MLTIDKEVTVSADPALSEIAPLSRLVFFDIETTGLSAARASLYLIGAVHYEAGSFRLVQYFAESLSDETELLAAFFSLLARKRRAASEEAGRPVQPVLLHFNGDGFDIPFLQKLILQYRLPYSFQGFLSLDLYKKVKPYKALLGLSDCKLKSVERALGVAREDRFSGGELIYVYEEYLRLRSIPEDSCEYNEQNQALLRHLLKTLLLHHEEDMANLPRLCAVLAYDALVQKAPQFLSAAIQEAPVKREHCREVLELRFRLPAALPKPLSCCDEWCALSTLDAENGENGELQLLISLYEGELLYFFPDYRNYYYLPAEDYAIHKSVGAFVERSARKQATKRTCYQKKSGRFLPEPEEIFSPVFYKGYGLRPLYAEFPEELIRTPDAECFSAYARALLRHCFQTASK